MITGDVSGAPGGQWESQGFPGAHGGSLWGPRRARGAFRVGVFDTLSDSIQYLNFPKKRFIQFSIQYCFTQDSIQNVIKLKEKSAD